MYCCECYVMNVRWWKWPGWG